VQRLPGLRQKAARRPSSTQQPKSPLNPAQGPSWRAGAEVTGPGDLCDTWAPCCAQIGGLSHRGKAGVDQPPACIHEALHRRSGRRRAGSASSPARSSRGLSIERAALGGRLRGLSAPALAARFGCTRHLVAIRLNLPGRYNLLPFVTGRSPGNTHSWSAKQGQNLPWFPPPRVHETTQTHCFKPVAEFR